MRAFPATSLYLIDSTVMYVILPKMTVHHILLYLSCLQYIIFMLFQCYIVFTVIYVILPKMTVYLSCLQYIIFMRFQRCNALTYFALPRSFPDFYFITKSANIIFAFFYKKLKSLEYVIVEAIFWHFPRILRQ